MFLALRNVGLHKPAPAQRRREHDASAVAVFCDELRTLQVGNGLIYFRCSLCVFLLCLWCDPIGLHSFSKSKLAFNCCLIMALKVTGFCYCPTPNTSGTGYYNKMSIRIVFDRFLCLFVSFVLCFFVSKITRKRRGRFAWNFQVRCGLWSDHRTTWLNLGSIQANGSASQRSICYHRLTGQPQLFGLIVVFWQSWATI